jgi:O-antigen ligase
LGLAIGLIVLFGYSIGHLEPGKKEPVVFALSATVFSLLFALVIFHPFIFTRTTVSDSASLERIFYARLGWKMTLDHPIFGVGVGESVLHMQQYSPIKLWPWQIQPVHNYFLLAAAELGIPGALILLWVFLSHLWTLWLKIKNKGLRVEKTYLVIFGTILISFLVMMQFDHYFYTLQQTQMLLWVFLGIMASQTKTPHSPTGERGA